MAPKKKSVSFDPKVFLGVDEGAEIVQSSEDWERMTLAIGTVVEVCVMGSSVGFGTEEWFALLIVGSAVSIHGGQFVTGEVLGAESSSILSEVTELMRGGRLHLCMSDPCPLAAEDHMVHATRVRCWTAEGFDADYLTKAGKNLLAAAIKGQAGVPASAGKAPGTDGRRRKAKAAPAPSLPARRRRTTGGGKDGVIEIGSEDGDEEDGGGREAPVVDRSKLRSLLKATRERILGDPPAAKRRRRAEDSPGGPEPEPSSLALAKSPLVAGTSLNPGQQSLVALDQSGDTSAAGVKRWKKALGKKTDNASQLLAQAVQCSERDAKKNREKRRSSRKDPLKKLAKLLGGRSKKSGKKKERKRKKGKQKEREERGLALKPDPDGSDDPGDSDYSSSYSSGRETKSEADSEDGSELSYEAPLRRRATRSPGSVMEMLIKHAQEQLDRGALLESEGARPGLTSGVKIGTYFALLIRPYYAAGSPLLRELYALGQAIDLLRAGRLPETADALAGRFVAVHTALSEGNWATASQLELYPLEPIQSASVATMLKAQRHKKLVQKSQGLTPGRWGGGNYGKGKGKEGGAKGQKGESKGKTKGGGRGGNKGQPWTRKGESNPWKESHEEPAKK